VTSTRQLGLEIGRYVLFEEMASGGMATVHYGRLSGPAGFSRTVAIKRLHPAYSKDPEFLSMFFDEARIAARVRHPNVVATLDVVMHEAEVLLVMEYVHGASLSQVLRALRGANEAVPLSIVAAIVVQVLFGLHAAHEAKGESGGLLDVVHRDVSPQNILVGVDGVVRVADFGIAKAVGRLQTTVEGHVKGKTAYMAPEQMRGREVDRRADVFATGIVLWETLTGQRLFTGDSPIAVMNEVLEKPIPPPSNLRPDVPAALDVVVARALDRDVAARFTTAREMAVAIETATPMASTREVGEWLEAAAADVLTKRALRVAEIESGSGSAPTVSPGDAESVEVRGLTGTGTTHVAEASSPSPATKTKKAAPFILASLLLAVIVVAASVTWRGSREAADRTSATPVGTASAGEALPVASTHAAAVEASAPVASASVSTSASVVSKPMRAPDPTRSKAAIRPPDCKPPYTFDKAGNRHWKDGC
jgi:eukaryotic-like serine/threonine-protein kinase